MNREQAFERVRRANPLPRGAAGPDAFLSQTALLEHIDAIGAGRRGQQPPVAPDRVDQPVERRRTMQTREHPVEVARQPRVPRSTRRLVPALAGALIVMVIGVGIWAVTRTPDDRIADRSPLTVAELFNEGMATAGFAQAGELYAPDATYQINWDGSDGPVIRFADPLPETADVADWDGDGVVTELDGFFWGGAELYAAGTTSFLSCSQTDPTTAVCQELREGYAFPNPAHSATWTITVNDGLLTSIVIEGSGQGTLPAAVAEYQTWVRENRPELEADLFEGFATVRLTPDTIHTHRQLVTEWQAQR